VPLFKSGHCVKIVMILQAQLLERDLGRDLEGAKIAVNEY
jgi:hypothetical protein